MDKVQEGSLTERQQYWLNHIRACEALGKSIADYAVDHCYPSPHFSPGGTGY